MKSENIITILVLTISIIYLLNFQESFSEESMFNIKNISTTGATGPKVLQVLREKVLIYQKA